MISNTLVALVAVLGATTLASASAIPEPRQIFPIIPLFRTCVDENLKDCSDWGELGLSIGCGSLDDPVNAGGLNLANDVSSVATLDPRTGCTLFTSTTCTGRSLFVNGTINALSEVNFDNVANSFSCRQIIF
ncbi:hypothetical protein C8R46DRAFT_1031363 [Mycena filopes]|nr:hypothetical protein C8R46DRAFT_1031363 [Mycena filopes]